MRNRTLALLLGATLVFGGLAACGDDDDDDDGGTETTETTEGGGDEGGESGNADVEAFCEAVDEYVAAAQEFLEDPASGDSEALTAQGTELGQQGADLAANAAELTPEDSTRLQECTAGIAEALTP